MKNPIVTIQTGSGKITLELYPEYAPNAGASVNFESEVFRNADHRSGAG